MTVSVLFLFLTMPFVIVVFPHHTLTYYILSAVVSVVFPVYTNLLFAYLVSSYYNECFIHSTISN